MNIEYFHELMHLSKTLSFSIAASQLNMSKAALSKHIGAIESEFGLRLFERDSHSVKLTYNGSLFLEKVSAMLEGYEEMRHFAIGDESLKVAGCFNNSIFLERLESAFREVERRPGTFFSFASLEFPQAYDDLLGGALDFYIDFAQPFDDPSIASIPLCDDPMCAFVDRASDLEDQVHLADLRNKVHTFVDSPGLRPGWNVFRNACLNAGFEPKYRLADACSVLTGKGPVLDEKQCFVVASNCSAAERLRRRNDLRCVAIDDASFPYRLYFNTRIVNTHRDAVVSLLS